MDSSSLDDPFEGFNRSLSLYPTKTRNDFENENEPDQHLFLGCDLRPRFLWLLFGRGGKIRSSLIRLFADQFRANRESSHPTCMSESKPAILLVEDNDEDVFLLRRALRKNDVDCVLQTAEDGESAIEYLSGAGKYADRTLHPFPSLVLLDLKLPYVNGFEVLAWIATQPSCRDLRIIVLTSSGEEPDRAKAAQFGIREYFLKPPTSELVAKVVKTLQEIDARATQH